MSPSSTRAERTPGGVAFRTPGGVQGQGDAAVVDTGTWSDSFSFDLTAPTAWELRVGAVVHETTAPAVTIFDRGLRHLWERMLKGRTNLDMKMWPIEVDGTFDGFDISDSMVGRSLNPFVNGWKFFSIAGGETATGLGTPNGFQFATGTNPYTTGFAAGLQSGPEGGGNGFGGSDGAVVGVAPTGVNVLPTDIIAGFDFGGTWSDPLNGRIFFDLLATLNRLSGGWTHVGSLQLLDRTFAQSRDATASTRRLRLAADPATFDVTDTFASHVGFTQFGAAELAAIYPFSSPTLAEIENVQEIDPGLTGDCDGVFLTTNAAVEGTELRSGSKFDEGVKALTSGEILTFAWAGDIVRA